MSASIASSWLLLWAYARFLKQFRLNHVHQIQNTTDIIMPVYRYQVLFVVLATLIFPIAIYQNLPAAAASALAGLPGTIVMIAMYFVIRRYVATAQAELPALAAGAGDDAPGGNYWPWKPLLLTLLVIALVVVALGFLLGA